MEPDVGLDLTTLTPRVGYLADYATQAPPSNLFVPYSFSLRQGSAELKDLIVKLNKKGWFIYLRKFKKAHDKNIDGMAR